MLSKEEGEKIVEAAFQPFKCDAAVIDYGRHFKFQVFDSEGNKIYGVSAPSDILKSEGLLRDMLKKARKAVEKKGHTLEPWKL